jgi:hypothetical protein
MKALALLLQLGISLSSIAQKDPIKFGDIPLKDLEMTVYDKDSSAEAVILADYGQSTITYQQTVGFKLTFERITRIKILKKEGLDWANFEIPLYNDGSDTEKASSVKGVTYNLVNGKVVESKLSNDGKFKEKRTDNLDILKVTMPSVKEGSVIELTYTVLSDFLSNFQDWTFQSTIPTAFSEYRANIPEYFRYDKYMQGYIAVTVSPVQVSPRSINFNEINRSGDRLVKSTIENSQVRYGESNHRWVANDVPAFREEPYLTTYKDYISKLNFELASINMPNQPVRNMMGSWEEINKKYFEELGGEIKANGFLKSTVEGLVAGAQSPEEKIAAITNFVKQNFSWTGQSTKFAENPLRKVFEEKKGSSAEINMILGSMLEKADIQVRPVLLSTRDHGMVRETSAVSTQFNYVLCMVTVDGKNILLDATERFLPINLIPERCLNGRGLALGKEAFDWIDLGSKTKTRSSVTADLTLSSTSLVGKLKLDHNGYAALQKRKNYFAKGESDYVKDFIGSHIWELNKSEIQNAKEVQNNFVEIHDVTINETVTPAGDILYIDPFIVGNIKTNPFKTEKREYPVNFGRPDEQVYVYKLTLPDDYVVDELPKNKLLAMPDNGGKYMYNATINGNVINITSILSINKGLFSQEEYPVLREFYNQVVAKQAEQIVLKKK